MFCFDKTGTLTNSGLEFIGLQGVESARFRPMQSPLKHDLLSNITLQGLATCHAVTKFGAQIVGNEVEVTSLRRCSSRVRVHSSETRMFRKAANFMWISHAGKNVFVRGLGSC